LPTRKHGPYTLPMAGGIPSGLGALLSRLGLGTPGQAPGGVDVKGLKTGAPAEKPGAEKGQVLGPEGTHLSGIGFNHADKTTGGKNVSEESAVSRFLEAVQEGEKPLLFKDPKGEVGQARKAETESKEAKDARDEKGLDTPLQSTKKDDQLEDKKSAAQLESNEQKQLKEKQETPDAEAARQQQQRERDKDEEKGHGNGWVLEEIETEEAQHKEKLREVDALGKHHRCHGTLEDGTSRCLRKPTEGQAYCPEHAAQWQIRVNRINQA
jgi:hypothetical protein